MRQQNGVSYIDLTGSDEESLESPPAKKRKSEGENFRSTFDFVPSRVKNLASKEASLSHATSKTSSLGHATTIKTATLSHATIKAASISHATIQPPSKRREPVGGNLSKAKDIIQAERESVQARQVNLSRAGDSFSGTDDFDELQTDKRLVGDEVPIILTSAQQAVVELAVNGHNIFLTGAAGSGKTATLLEIKRRLKTRFNERGTPLYSKVQVVAPTGIAALPLNGKTTYSFAGW